MFKWRMELEECSTGQHLWRWNAHKSEGFSTYKNKYISLLDSLDLVNNI